MVLCMRYIDIICTAITSHACTPGRCILSIYTFYRMDQNWQGGPLLATKISLGEAILAGGPKFLLQDNHECAVVYEAM